MGSKYYGMGPMEEGLAENPCPFHVVGPSRPSLDDIFLLSPLITRALHVIKLYFSS